MTEGKIRIEVTYAKPDEQTLLALEAARGITVEQAITRSGILRRYPEIDLTKNKIGVFGKLSKLDQALEDGDRVEIYLPLIADPKEARKKRAEQGKAMRKRN